MSESTQPIEAKVLTVSDGVVSGTRVDASGAALVDVLTAHGFSVVHTEVVSDGEAVVAQRGKGTGAAAELHSRR